jgi:hypothetical protein
MNSFLIFLTVITVLVILFVVIPNLLKTPVPLLTKAYVPPRSPLATHNKPQGTCQQNNMLDAYFPPPKEKVPQDYPQKDIGECPYTKPQPKPLPLADVPMCIAVKSQDMMLV